MNEPDRERHKTVRGCAERAKTPRWLSLMNVVTALGFSQTNTHPSITRLCKSFRMCSRPQFASTDWNVCLYAKGKLLPLKVTKAYKRVETYLHALVTSATDGSERSSSRLSHFNPGETTPSTQWMKGWIYLEVLQIFWRTENILTPSGNQSPSGNFGEQRISYYFRNS